MSISPESNIFTINKPRWLDKWIAWCSPHSITSLTFPAASHLSLPLASSRHPSLSVSLPSPVISWEFDMMQIMKPACPLRETESPAEPLPTTITKRSFTADRLAGLCSQFSEYNISEYHSFQHTTTSGCGAITRMPSLSSSQSSFSSAVTYQPSCETFKDYDAMTGIKSSYSANKPNHCVVDVSRPSCALALAEKNSGSMDCDPLPSPTVTEATFQPDLDSWTCTDAYYANTPTLEEQHAPPKARACSEMSFMEWDSDDETEMLQPLSRVNAIVKKGIADLKISSRRKSSATRSHSCLENSNARTVSKKHISLPDGVGHASGHPCEMRKQQRSYTYPGPRHLSEEETTQRASTINSIEVGCNLAQQDALTSMYLKEPQVNIHEEGVDGVLQRKRHLSQTQSSKMPRWTKRMRCA